MKPQTESYKNIFDDYQSRKEYLNYDPTPLRISKSIEIPSGNVFIKHEDMIHPVINGHKFRKLSFLAAEIALSGADTIVSAGSLASNQTKAVCLLANKMGMDCNLIYIGDTLRKPNKAIGNFLVTSLFNPKISWFEETSWSLVDDKLNELENELIKKGKKPYVIYPGITGKASLCASIELGFEIVEHFDRIGEKLSNIFAVAGSGYTCLGLKIACDLMGSETSIHGFGTGIKNTSGLDKTISAVYEEFVRKSEFNRGTNSSVIKWYADEEGATYDCATNSQFSLLRDAIVSHDLLLDPTYMIKPFNGLMNALREEVVTGNTVLLNSGGQVGFFEQNPCMEDWYKNNYGTFIF